MTTNESAEMVDWDLAVATARRLAKPGPAVTTEEARRVVEDLKAFAAEATAPVLSFTGLRAEAAQAPVVVVDRGGWAQANADGMREIITPLADKLRARRSSSGLMDQVGPKVTGVETGALLAFLAAKVLGQFDPFWSDASGSGAGAAGRLLLVAPNVVHVERELEVDSRDFRMWVCLHEETHRVQFTAVPWLRDHLRSEIASFIEATEVDPSVLLSRLRVIIKSVIESAQRGQDGPSVLELVQSPEQKAIIDRVTATMSLLEGHADVVMDGVGPEVVPSVATIREKFQRRRAGADSLDRTVRRLLGIEAKMRQYRDGAKFVNAVVDQVGMSGFNRVWESTETLPVLEEITDPVAWVRRVHGSSPLPRDHVDLATVDARIVDVITAAVAVVRRAVREALADLTTVEGVLVACSGGADSLALAAALAHSATRDGRRAGAVTVDHGLQAGSADRARAVAADLVRLGLDPVEVVHIRVTDHQQGPEGNARRARFAALDAAAGRHAAAAVLLGHTLDDQAESVLLGLARGSGARSLAGMAAVSGRYRRPLLAVTRETVRAAVPSRLFAVGGPAEQSDGTGPGAGAAPGPPGHGDRAWAGDQRRTRPDGGLAACRCGRSGGLGRSRDRRKHDRRRFTGRTTPATRRGATGHISAGGPPPGPASSGDRARQSTDRPDVRARRRDGLADRQVARAGRCRPSRQIASDPRSRRHTHRPGGLISA